ncbi:MAG: sensor histidine kinase [Novosphingobium sp.]|nr:sensor histidine kinase [Novosphingobium sp.]
MDNDLVRETNHRCTNDLQLVIGLLTLASRRTNNPETRDVLLETANRIQVVSEARRALVREESRTLTATLDDVVGALQVLAEPRGVEIAFGVDCDPGPVPDGLITTLALAVNELATNAIKHAFNGSGNGSGNGSATGALNGKAAGHIAIELNCPADGEIALTIEDDGTPFMLAAEEDEDAEQGFGLDLVRRLLARYGGTLALPSNGVKRFEVHVRTDGLRSWG